MNLLGNISLNKGIPENCENYIKTMKKEENEALNYFLSPKPNWQIVEGLKKKISESGNLLPFFGDTTVYTLKKEQSYLLASFQKQIRNELDFLAEALSVNQFHMTIHDLSNGPILNQLKSSIKLNSKKCIHYFKQISNYLKSHPNENIIQMKSIALFPCVNTSILLGVAPKTDTDYKKLINIFHCIDNIQSLNYWPRFHITLDYFKPIELDITQMNLIGKVLENVYREISFELDIKNIFYQHFFSMNNFLDQFKIDNF